jgi:hypothetical protein
VCGLSLVAVSVARGQGVTVRGVVYDSLHMRPLAAAMVSIGQRTTSSDSVGRFTILGLEQGVYRVSAQHHAIDRLGISAIGAELRVGNLPEMVYLGIPSFQNLWRVECGPRPPSDDAGFLFGTVRTTRRRGAVEVSASWINLSVEGTALSQKLNTLTVTADSLGNYALCGVPASTGFNVRATGPDSSASGTFDIPPLDSERVVRRDLRLVDRTVRATAMIAGRVLDDAGRGISGAEVTLVNADATTTSDSRGGYSFTELAPGSYRADVRKIGYAEKSQGVDVEADERLQLDVILSPMTMLDSVSVVGKILPRDEGMRVFEERRKIGLGKFLSATDLEKARGANLSTLIRQWPGIYIPPGRAARDRDPQSRRGIKSIMGGGGCRIALYLDGVRLAIPFDEVPPETLAGLEYYPGAASVPIEYARLNNQCGVILLHSRYKVGK